MPIGQKHLVKCRCVLPQFKHVPEPPQHQFVVFSVIDDNEIVKPKFVQCNNCGIIHKVTDICKSDIIQGRESMGSIRSIDDIKPAIPQALANILDANNADVPSWEMAEFILETEQWGLFVVLSVDTEGGTKQGKYVRILGKNMFKVDTFMIEEYARKDK